MELREYWEIFRRRWWIPVVLAAAVGAFSLLQLQPFTPRAPVYAASLRMLVGVLPAAEQDVTAYDPRYYAWLTSEYLVDDFTEVVRSRLFADNVSQRLAGANIQVPPGSIQANAATGKLHRIITLNFTWPNADELTQIAAAAAAELSENTPFYFRQLGTDEAGITVIDGPNVGPVAPGVRERIELPLRVVLAFLVGVGLVFLLHYFDRSVRRASDLDGLGLDVLASIPKGRGR